LHSPPIIKVRDMTGALLIAHSCPGAGQMLTDPQIISDLSLGRIFGGGNSSSGIKNFRVDHTCGGNRYCRHFGLEFNLLDEDIKVT